MQRRYNAKTAWREIQVSDFFIFTMIVKKWWNRKSPSPASFSFSDINPSPVPIFSTTKYNISRNPQIPNNTVDSSKNSLLVKSRNLTCRCFDANKSRKSQNKKQKKRITPQSYNFSQHARDNASFFVFRAVNNTRGQVRGSQDKATPTRTKCAAT